MELSLDSLPAFDSSGRRRRAPPEVRRAQILDAALRCFADRGFHAATMDHLVEASGLSKGSLYWHFSSKEDVLLAVFDAFEAGLFASWEQAAVGGGTPLEILSRMLKASSDLFEAQRPLFRTWLEFLVHPVARERMRCTYAASRSHLAAHFRRGIEAGEIRDVSPESLAAVVTATFEGLVLQALVDPDFDVHVHGPVLLDVLRDGLVS